MTAIPVVGDLPAITADQMREVDRVMIDDLGISLLQMMENAGRNLASLAAELTAPQRVTVLAGPGGNGGGGLTAARHLANREIAVTVVLARPELTPVPEQQRRILRSMGVPILDEPAATDLVIDALIGYSISGDPRGRAAELIRWANAQDAPVLSLDVPSGLDPTSGNAGTPVITATATMTLALPKTGLVPRGEHVGDLYLADISVPPRVYEAFGISLADPFAAGPVVRVVTASPRP